MSQHGLQDKFHRLVEEVNNAVIGQQRVIQQLNIALLAEGHVLLQGLPGLAKTRAVSCMAQRLDSDLNRIQFTPDMLPSDVTGSEIYHSHTQSLTFQQGPVFSQLLLADEINRAPAKVQAALLEAMAEGQVTVVGKTYQLPELFMVLATQNPVEQEGTYPLPEAQLDRFMMRIEVEYPDKAAELSMLGMLRNEANSDGSLITPILSVSDVLNARKAVNEVTVSEAVDQYIVDLVHATRDASMLDQQLANWIFVGASPRASIALDKCARAHAWLNQRHYVLPEDVRAVAYPVLGHRLALSFEASGDRITSKDVVGRLLDVVAWV
ncbi:AAA family ATPase [Aliagarivorans marinus]|uniref:AAA family ATPase n=1 Tax=Aliagarivorans marinus TaxID=561965 RepID=UPI0003FE8A21|nr:MoxR family ATPase [Aliagarivorans marinus]